MRLELGEISDQEFAAVERDVLERLRAIKGARGRAISMSPSDTVEIDTFREEGKA
jgi:hypothetical protein